MEGNALAMLNDENEGAGSNEVAVNLVKVNYFTGELTRLGNIKSGMMPSSQTGNVPQVIACDDDGTFYIINASTSSSRVNLYKLTESDLAHVSVVSGDVLTLNTRTNRIDIAKIR